MEMTLKPDVLRRAATGDVSSLNDCGRTFANKVVSNKAVRICFLILHWK